MIIKSGHIVNLFTRISFILIIISFLSNPVFCQLSDSISSTYYKIFFQSQLSSGDTLPTDVREGEVYKLNYYSSVDRTNAVTDTVSFYPDVIYLSKDSFSKSPLETSELAFFFYNSNNSCWMSSEYESVLRGDTLEIFNVKKKNAGINYEIKEFCEGTSQTVSPGYDRYITDLSFSSPDGLNVDKTSGNINLTGQNTGYFIVQYSTSYCLTKNQDTIRIKPNVSVDFPKREYCQNDPEPIFPVTSDNQSIPDLTYISPGLETNAVRGAITLMTAVPGTYKVEFQSSGCLRNTVDTIIINPTPEYSIEKNRKICEGRTIEIVPFSAKNNVTYKWSDEKFANSLSVSEPGNYVLTAINEFGCMNNDTVHVELKQIKLEGTYFITDADCNNPGNIILNTMNVVDGLEPYVFQLQNRISGEKIHDMNHIREGDYILSAEDAEGCRTNYEHQIRIRKDCLNDYPVFSPNTDGLDDDYYIPFEGEAIVYDRNGIEKKRFTAPAYWDGTDSSGNYLPMGNYFIVIGKEMINITIIR